MRKHLALASLCLFIGTPAQAEAPVENKAAASAQVSPQKERVLTFAMMGQPTGAKLSGLSHSVRLNSGIRLDELVTHAKLDLKVMYPQGMRHDQSFIRVYINEQLAAISQLSANKAGMLHSVQMDLDPTLFTDFATLRVEYDGTYDSVCKDPSNPTLRFDIRPDSALTITSRPVTLVNDLALLPAPFFDPRDNRKLNLPLVIPGKRTPSNLKAAGILTSWLGAQAFFRQSEFELARTIPEDKHTIILSTGENLPNGFAVKDLQGPMLYMDSSPNKPYIKRLYVMGRNEDELLKAVYGLVIEGQALSGQKAYIKEVNLGAPRKPYDAPRYISTQRPVRFAELMDYSTQLEASYENNKVRLNLRVPPDLFGWPGRNIPVDLKYRYTAPSVWNDSLLNIEINDALIQSFRLPPRGDESPSKLGLDVLSSTELAREESFQIPAFRAGGNNDLSFKFAFMPQGSRACTTDIQPARASIDPESTLDLSNLPHYTKMPNLAAFANGGYPFSIIADLADTALILPANPTDLETSAYLNIMGLFGQWTGLPANRITVLTSDKIDEIGPKHWLALGPSNRLAWLNAKEMNLPMVLSNTQRQMGLPKMVRWLQNMWITEEELSPDEKTQAMIETSGSLGAIMGFESHLHDQQAGLVITGTDQEGFYRAVKALSNYDNVAKVKGSVSLIRDDKIQSYQLGNTYISGSLPWWLHLRIALSRYPALVALGGALTGVLLALLAYGWLSRRAERRKTGAA